MSGHVFIATSLDGFIARPDGDIDWLPAIESGEDYGYHAFMAGIDAIVMGRASFEKVLSFGEWPYGETPVVVLSSRQLELPARLAGMVHAMRGEPREIEAQCATRGWNELYVDGGATIQRFLTAGCITRLIITRIPVLIGEGLPLFGPAGHDIPLAHVRTQSYGNGLVQSEYRVTPDSSRG